MLVKPHQYAKHPTLSLGVAQWHFLRRHYLARETARVKQLAAARVLIRAVADQAVGEMFLRENFRRNVPSNEPKTKLTHRKKENKGMRRLLPRPARPSPGICAHKGTCLVPFWRNTPWRRLLSFRTGAEAEQAAFQALRDVQEPELRESVIDLGYIKGVSVRQPDPEHASVDINVQLPTPACPYKQELEENIKRCVSDALGLGPMTSVRVRFSARAPAAPRTAGIRKAAGALERVSQIIAVSSCKGGVGKSSIAANLAFTLHQMGGRVGLLDADIYGPSLPALLGSAPDTTVVRQENGRITPVEFEGVRCMSYGFVARRNKRGERRGTAMRGPMVSSVVQQLAQFTDWGPLDYLVVDFPPGLGDIQLTLGQKLALSGSVVVTTPQKLSTEDVIAGLDLFQELRVPTLGLVENMSYFDGDDGKRYFPFGTSHSQELMRQFAIEHLTTLPIDPRLSGSSNAGYPAVLSAASDDPLRQAFHSLGDAVVRRLIREAARGGRDRTSVSYDSDRHEILVRTISRRGGSEYRLSPLLVRRRSGSASADREASVDPSVTPTKIEPEGNYGVRIEWSDGHDTSIYSYAQLKAWGSEQERKRDDDE